MVAVLCAAGCNSGTPTGPAVPAKPLEGEAFTFGSADPAVAKLLAARAAGWGAATGAKATATPADSADLIVIRPAELGALAAAGKLAPLPVEWRATDHPLQRARILEVYRDALSGWGGTAYALPVAGDGSVLVTRRDLLDDPKVRAASQAKRGRDPSPPGTYEELAELAELVTAATGRPALAPLPPGDAALLAHFQRIVTCYDRPAALTRSGREADSALALHYSVSTLSPRVTSPGFVRAAQYLARTRQLRPAAPADPVDALNAGAVSAILTLRELTHLPREGGAVAARFTVSPLPGTRGYFDANSQEIPGGGRGNYVPFVGSGSWVAVVRAGAKSPAAAWTLAAELAGVGSLATLANPAIGAGPFRREDLEAARESVWLSYRFSEQQTKQLAEALRAEVAVNVVNPAIVLRTPDQAARMADLAHVLRKVAAGELDPPKGMADVEAAWQTRDAALPPEVVATWKRNAANIP